MITDIVMLAVSFPVTLAAIHLIGELAASAHRLFKL